MSQREHDANAQAPLSTTNTVTQANPSQVNVSAVFPTGLESSVYDPQSRWKNRRWAWEFLIRNPDFRVFCDRVLVEKLTSDEVTKTSLIEFGLLKFKDYREPFGARHPKFSSAQASFWSDTSNGTFGDRKKKRIPSGPGEIIFRVSLRDALHPKNRKALLRHIDSVLEQRSSEWAKNNGFTPSQTTQRGDLLALLRILDLVAYNDLLPKQKQRTRTQLFAIVYPKIACSPTQPTPLPSQFDKPFNERWTLAKKMTHPERYLSLAATI